MIGRSEARRKSARVSSSLFGRENPQHRLRILDKFKNNQTTNEQREEIQMSPGQIEIWPKLK